MQHPMTWGQFRAARPDLATKGREFLYEYGVGLGFLATVRRDGGPRVHPICPIFTDGALYGFIVPGPKLNDLRRDPRYALHSETFPPPRQDDGFYITGTASEVSDAPTFDRMAAQFLAERGQHERRGDRHGQLPELGIREQLDHGAPPARRHDASRPTSPPPR